MRVLHVIAQLPARTGSGIYFRNLIDELASFGHEQAAIFALQDDFSFSSVGECVQSSARSKRSEATRGFEGGNPLRFREYPVRFKTPALPFPVVGMSDVMPYESTRYADLDEDMLDAWQSAFQCTLHKTKQDFQPELIISHHLWLLTALVVQAFPDCPKIAVCHNTEFRQAELCPELKANHVTHLDQLDLVFSLSEDQNQKIAKVFTVVPSDIVVAGAGFNQNYFFPPDQIAYTGKTINIVYAGKIAQAKGVYELIPAFEKLDALWQEQQKQQKQQKQQEQGGDSNGPQPKLHLNIVGDPQGSDATAFNRLIAGKSNITLLPAMNQKELGDFFRTQDIFVLPSYFEGMPLIVLEALACGMRVVSTEADALIRLLGDEIAESGVIEYVKLPRLHTIDKPHEEDIGQFTEELAQKIYLQARRAAHKQALPQKVLQSISNHSWKNLAGKVDEQIRITLSRAANS